ADLPRELRRWEMTRTRIATNGMWLLDPVITDLKRWWQLPAGQSGLTGPGTPLNTEPQTQPAERRQERTPRTTPQRASAAAAKQAGWPNARHGKNSPAGNQPSRRLADKQSTPTGKLSAGRHKTPRAVRSDPA